MGYSEDDRDVALQWFVLRKTAIRMAWAAATVAALAGAALGFAAGKAMGDSISISGSIVTLEPSPDPQAVAQVRFDNFQNNSERDNGAYSVTMDGLIVGLAFIWEVDMFGSDAVEVIPPAWLICVPESCTAVAMEGYTGTVTLYPYHGY